MLDQAHDTTVRDLARSLTGRMEALCCGCRDADGRTVGQPHRLRQEAELIVAKLAAIVCTDHPQHKAD